MAMHGWGIDGTRGKRQNPYQHLDGQEGKEMAGERVRVLDTTLRDGAQGMGISYTVADKVRIARILDRLGVDWVEGGWPGANPKDDAFFAAMRGERLTTAELVAFGSTARPGRPVAQDPGLAHLVETGVHRFCIFGKSWDLHVERGLRISLEDNLRLIRDSVAYLRRYGRVLYDAEHFFDGFRSHPAYALRTLEAAAEGGADCLVLCDTNGGSLPWQVEEAVAEVRRRLDGVDVGIHAHDDGGLAVANTLAAVRAGARHVQGTLNGYGERTGNARLSSVLPDLVLKMGYRLHPSFDLSNLTAACREVAEVANLPLPDQLAYVGRGAFAHKGGVHVAAVKVDPRMYEHVAPETVGNVRRVLVSDQAGRSNLLVEEGWGGEASMRAAGPNLARILGRELTLEEAALLVEDAKALEHRGYSYESAEASLVLVGASRLGIPLPAEPLAFRVTTEVRHGVAFSEATVQVRVADRLLHTAAAAQGPVHALDLALRKALVAPFPMLEKVHLTDYKVRVLDGDLGTGAKVRVTITSQMDEEVWGTVGVSDNVVEASWQALWESLVYPLLLFGAVPAPVFGSEATEVTPTSGALPEKVPHPPGPISQGEGLGARGQVPST
jgi:2-isopropylmalate synthase